MTMLNIHRSTGDKTWHIERSNLVEALTGLLRCYPSPLVHTSELQWCQPVHPPITHGGASAVFISLARLPHWLEVALFCCDWLMACGSYCATYGADRVGFVRAVLLVAAHL